MRSLPDHGPLQIVVLAGGASAEREVSLDSGRTVAAALTALGHHVELLIVVKDSAVGERRRTGADEGHARPANAQRSPTGTARRALPASDCSAAA